MYLYSACMVLKASLVAVNSSMGSGEGSKLLEQHSVCLPHRQQVFKAWSEQ